MAGPVEAVAANLCILKSPTVMRQFDGRLWGWEGCDEDNAQGPGTCTHVWNYAQAIAHLFPSLERSLRETEFRVAQDSTGHQNFRVALPIQPAPHDFYAAADGYAEILRRGLAQSRREKGAEQPPKCSCKSCRKHDKISTLMTLVEDLKDQGDTAATENWERNLVEAAEEAIKKLKNQPTATETVTV